MTESDPSPKRSLTSVRVLVADDEPSSRSVCRRSSVKKAST